MTTVSHTTVTAMENVLAETLKPVNDKYIEDGMNRINWLYKQWKEYCDNTPYKDRDLYKQFDLCGGKTNYLYFRDTNLTMVQEREMKHLLGTIEKRDAKIVKKLIDKNITDITGVKATGFTDDGYQGVFIVGDYTLNINIIYAGGYHIQRAHLRTLVDLRDKDGKKVK